VAGERVRLIPNRLQGIEAVQMIRKGRARWVAKQDAIAQAIAELFGIAA